MSVARTERLGEQIRIEVSAALAREVHDPGVGFVTLTRVQVTPDLQLARVYYTVLGDEAARKETARALGRVTPFVRRLLGDRLQVRRVPELEFVFDRAPGHQARIEELLREIHDREAPPTPSLEDAADTGRPDDPDR